MIARIDSFLSQSQARRIALVAAALGFSAACDPAPSLTVHGQVQSALEAGDTSADDGVAVAVVWVGGSENDIVFPVADLATVSGDFPASYSIDVRPPAASAATPTASSPRKRPKQPSTSASRRCLTFRSPASA